MNRDEIISNVFDEFVKNYPDDLIDCQEILDERTEIIDYLADKEGFLNHGDDRKDTVVLNVKYRPRIDNDEVIEFLNTPEGEQDFQDAIWFFGNELEKEFDNFIIIGRMGGYWGFSNPEIQLSEQGKQEAEQAFVEYANEFIENDDDDEVDKDSEAYIIDTCEMLLQSVTGDVYPVIYETLLQDYDNFEFTEKLRNDMNQLKTLIDKQEEEMNKIEFWKSNIEENYKGENRMNIRKLTEELNRLIEETELAEKPKSSGSSFNHFLRSKVQGNDLNWDAAGINLDDALTWDAALKDPDDGYTWYLPMRYTFNAEKVAEAVRRNLKRGSGAYLESKVDLLPAGDIDDEPTLRIKFKNTKIQRELGLDNFSKEYDELVDKFKAQKATGFPTLYEYLCDLYGVDYNEFKKRKRAVKQESYTEFYEEDEEDNVPTLRELKRMILGESLKSNRIRHRRIR